ncbi:ADP compounds hydrolase NudE [Neptunicella sp. SCSIO 80796]|uniref:ADP compounds hydrolase NudE n=1 Tax=Neptunicella plasticusilytica TaxID=3117012 RepID=UPI003A4E0BFA
MSKTAATKVLPIIHHREQIASTKIFRIESLDLEFSNGVTRQYERMAGSGRGAVMMIPFIDEQTFLLVREYAAGTNSYQLGFPKGLIDPGESPEQAANRELKEEVGYGAHQLDFLHRLQMAPTFFNSTMTILIARNLFPERLPGDEPEPLEIVPWKVNQLESLLAQDDFTEARSVAALLLFERWLRSK